MTYPSMYHYSTIPVPYIYYWNMYGRCSETYLGIVQFNETSTVCALDKFSDIFSLGDTPLSAST